MTDTSISSLSPSRRNAPSLGGVRLGRLPVLRSSAVGQREREFAGACVWPKAQSLAAHGESMGSKRGASERRYQAMPGDVQRLTLLAEPHTATLRDGKDLYGMQEVRGSNPPKLRQVVFTFQWDHFHVWVRHSRSASVDVGKANRGGLPCCTSLATSCQSARSASPGQGPGIPSRMSWVTRQSGNGRSPRSMTT
jgi:hypothetical protein